MTRCDLHPSKRPLFLPGLTLLLLAGMTEPAAAERKAGGEIKGNVVWTKAESPYFVTEDITIPVGSRLTIEPGVLVKMKPNLADQKGIRPFDLEFAVYGTLDCQGADGDSIYFTSDAVDQTTQDWGGIIVAAKGGIAKIDRTVIEAASSGITVMDGELDLERSQVRSCSERGVHFLRGSGKVVKSYITIIGNYAGTGKGIYLIQSPDVLIDETFVIGAQTGIALERGSDAKIRHSLVSLCRGPGLSISSSNPEVTENNITQNDNGVIIRGHALPRIHNNNIFENAGWEVQVREYRADPTPDGSMFRIDLSNNWWGRDVTPDVVYDRIDDGDDVPAAGAAVRIEPVRSEAWQAK